MTNPADSFYSDILAERAVGAIVYVDPETMTPLAGKRGEVVALFRNMGDHLVSSVHGSFVAPHYAAHVRLLPEDRKPGELPHEIVSLGSLLTPAEFFDIV